MVKTAHSPKARSAIVAAVLAAVLAAPFAERASAQIGSDEAAIAEFNRKYLKAINDGDIDTLAALTTDGHMMIMSGGPPRSTRVRRGQIYFLAQPDGIYFLAGRPGPRFVILR